MAIFERRRFGRFVPLPGRLVALFGVLRIGATMLPCLISQKGGAGPQISIFPML
jgi:hypothetical protein